jgi:hypothetical protein
MRSCSVSSSPSRLGEDDQSPAMNTTVRDGNGHRRGSIHCPRPKPECPPKPRGLICTEFNESNRNAGLGDLPLA